MVYRVTISKNGAITIPTSVRKALALKAGQKVAQSIKGNKVLLDVGADEEGSIPQERRLPKK